MTSGALNLTPKVFSIKPATATVTRHQEFKQHFLNLHLRSVDCVLYYAVIKTPDRHIAEASKHETQVTLPGRLEVRLHQLKYESGLPRGRSGKTQSNN
jgi:hypothetical protein